jgi:hypothetical protein
MHTLNMLCHTDLRSELVTAHTDKGHSDPSSPKAINAQSFVHAYVFLSQSFPERLAF